MGRMFGHVCSRFSTMGVLALVLGLGGAACGPGPADFGAPDDTVATDFGAYSVLSRHDANGQVSTEVLASNGDKVAELRFAAADGAQGPRWSVTVYGTDARTQLGKASQWDVPADALGSLDEYNHSAFHAFSVVSSMSGPRMGLTLGAP